MLSGWKTYLAVAGGLGVLVARGLGYLDDGTAGWLLGVLGFGGMAGLRSAIGNLRRPDR